MSVLHYQRAPVVLVFSGASGTLTLPAGYLLHELLITLVAGGSAIGSTASTITTTGLNGLSFRMSGAVAINSVDRLDWKPNVPTQIDRLASGNPLITFPAVTNGTWHCIALVEPK